MATTNDKWGIGLLSAFWSTRAYYVILINRFSMESAIPLAPGEHAMELTLRLLGLTPAWMTLGITFIG